MLPFNATKMKNLLEAVALRFHVLRVVRKLLELCLQQFKTRTDLARSEHLDRSLIDSRDEAIDGAHWVPRTRSLRGNSLADRSVFGHCSSDVREKSCVGACEDGEGLTSRGTLPVLILISPSITEAKEKPAPASSST